VNHDETAGFNDLLAVLTGNFYADDGSIHPIYKKYSQGRIQTDKTKIHLFVWLDDSEPDRMFFMNSDRKHHARLCSVFGINAKELKAIGS
jgi:hypothetical protein